MYYSGQIIWDLDGQCPIRAEDIAELTGWAGHGKRRTTHFITAATREDNEYPREVEVSASPQVERQYVIALPKTAEEASALMREGRIFPAPVPYTHCTKCMNWLSNHKKDGSCWTKEK